MKILSPMAFGNGAFVVHRLLAASIEDYRLVGFSPVWEYCPIALLSMRARAADVVHTMPDYAPYVRKRGVPLVISFQNFVIDPWMRRYSSLAQRIHYATDLRWAIRSALRTADVVTAVSDATRELVRSHLGFPGTIHVIPNGVNTVTFAPGLVADERKEVVVLFSGNPTRRKGGHWLKRIARALDRNVRVLVTGGLRGGRRVRSDRIEHIGMVPHDRMAQLYRGADLLLFPTVREGMSLSALEAMSSGLPVVTSDIPSMAEIVHHGKGGFLCALGNCDEFAGRINELARDPRLRQAMGRYNRRLVEDRYRDDRMVEGYRALFRTVARQE